MLYAVREHLFIGNIQDAAEILQNGSNEITHVLSVLSSESISFFSEWRSELSIPSKEIRKVHVGGSGSEDVSTSGLMRTLPPDKILYSMEYAGKDLKFVRMAVPFRDSENENLLDHLDVCLDFIEDGRKEGSVLVHCFAGVSRSAAVIMAYLMKSEGLSQEDALESLRQSYESVCPNDGFLEQLKMFEQMGFKVDRASPNYKRFRLKLLEHWYHRGEKIDYWWLGVDPGLASEKFWCDSSRVYQCKQCNRVVAVEENVVHHVPGEGERQHSKCEQSECSSIFIEPMRWMLRTVERVEGKLLCPKCEGWLGSFNWCGMECSCGSWISPAFQIHKTRVA